MEPTNFEQQSREKFEERQLQPSANAWGKLEQMLDKAHPEKKKAAFPWFAIAASFVGIALIATIFFNQNTKKENNFVEQDVNAEIFKTENPIINNTINNKEEIAITEDTIETEFLDTTSSTVANTENTKVHNEKEKAIATKSNYKPNVIKNQVSVAKDKKVLAVTNKKEQEYLNHKNIKTVTKATTKAQKDQMVAVSEENKLKKDAIENAELDSEVETLIAQVKQLKNTKTEVTEADIDALLITAQQQLKVNRILNNTTVDAMALLEDAEMQLNDSFRDKIFYALEEGFDYVKSTIVTRNN